MLYELLPLLRGWKYQNFVHIPAGQVTVGVATPADPGAFVGIEGSLGRGRTEPIIDSDQTGWLLSVIFKASDASAKCTVHVNDESYEIMQVGSFEPPSPMPFNVLRVDVTLDTQSSVPAALYYCAVNRIIVEDLDTFKRDLLEVLGPKGFGLLKELEEKKKVPQA